MDFDLNVEAAPAEEHESQDNRSETVLMCTICRERLSNDGHRTCVTLQCGHHFHLDCIGSTFNGKKEMRCPNCRNLEQGRWSIPRDSPDPDTVADVSIVFRGFGIYSSDLIFGCDLCPFEGSGSIYNSVEELIHLDQSDDFHKPGPEGRHYCPFVEYLFTIVGPENDLNSQQIAGGWDPLSPLTPIPTNPRLFRSGSQPQVIIARRYLAHPVIDPPTLGESINLLLANNQVVPSDPRDNLLGNFSIAVDDQVVPSYPWDNLAANVSMHPLHLGSSVAPNAPMANDSVVQPYQDANFVANVPMVQSYSSDNLAVNASLQQFHPGDNLVPNALMDNDSVVRHYQDINLVANVPLVQPYPWDNLAANGSVHRFHLGDNALMDNDSVVRPYQDINLVANVPLLVQRSRWDNLAANASVHSLHLRDSLIPNAPMAYDSVVQPYHINLVANVPLVPPLNDNVIYYANDLMPNVPVVAWPYPQSTIVSNAPMVQPSPSRSSVANAVPLPYQCNNIILFDCGCSSDGGTSRSGGGEPF